MHGRSSHALRPGKNDLTVSGLLFSIMALKPIAARKIAAKNAINVFRGIMMLTFSIQLFVKNYLYCPVFFIFVSSALTKVLNVDSKPTLFLLLIPLTSIFVVPSSS